MHILLSLELSPQTRIFNFTPRLFPASWIDLIDKEKNFALPRSEMFQCTSMFAKNIIDVYGIDLVLFFGIDSTMKFHFRLILDLKYILEGNFHEVKMILAIV